MALLLIARILASILFIFEFFAILNLNGYLGIMFQQSVYIGILFSVWYMDWSFENMVLIKQEYIRLGIGKYLFVEFIEK